RSILRVWDLKSRDPIADLPSAETPVWSGDGKRLVVAHRDVSGGQGLQIWSIDTLQQRVNAWLPVVALPFGTAGKRLSVAGENAAEVWDVRAVKDRRVLVPGIKPEEQPHRIAVCNGGEVWSLRGAAGGKQLEVRRLQPAGRSVFIPNPQPGLRAPTGIALS